MKTKNETYSAVLYVGDFRFPMALRLTHLLNQIKQFY